WRACVLCVASRVCYVVFFFSSRRRHTRLVSDWSSDVCSSDLVGEKVPNDLLQATGITGDRPGLGVEHADQSDVLRVRRRPRGLRSEERRVGKEWRSRWSPYHWKKKITATADEKRGDTSVSGCA